MNNKKHIYFWKYQALGNDFIIIDERETLKTAPSLPLKRRIELCDRNFGIGADGVLTLLNSPNPLSDFYMHITNSDGSEPQMCGNGLRCVVRYLLDQEILISENDVVNQPKESLHIHAKHTIDTPAGLHHFKIAGTSSQQIEIQMVQAQFEDVCINGPMIAKKRTFLSTETKNVNSPAEKLEVVCTAVSMGNPHLVLFDQPTNINYVKKWGPHLVKDKEFSDECNVSFSSLNIDQDSGALEIKLTVFERGAGLTLACGTGACATVAAYVMAKRIPMNTAIKVKLPGGSLFVTVQEGFTVLLSGSAALVFQGHLKF